MSDSNTHCTTVSQTVMIGVTTSVWVPFTGTVDVGSFNGGVISLPTGGGLSPSDALLADYADTLSNKTFSGYKEARF